MAVDQILEALITKDPGLPRPDPTRAYWQHETHALSTTQSPVLQTTDVAVIGSGITGVSVAKTLLEHHPTQHITVFEARTLCSGATGRNGGQLAINAAETYQQLKLEVGAEMAGKIIQFNIKTLDRLRDIAREYATNDPECTDVTKLRSFKDPQSFEKVKNGIKALETDHPSLKGIYSILTAAECEKDHGVFGVAGGVCHPAGSVWPWRMVMNVFERLLGTYNARLAIEANTPVTSVRYSPAEDANRPYVLSTPRGEVRCAHVAYCTNGFTGHILPSLRGGLFPMKGTMSVQDLGDLLKNKGSSESWAIHYTPFTNATDETIADGLIYGIQNAKTGAFFFGGEKSRIQDLLSSDDTDVSASSIKFLQQSLLSLFGRDPEMIQDSKLISSWSGIMCFSSDGMPLVGNLPETVTGRSGGGEWLCAAYSGYGMPTAWLAGENLARLILDLPVQKCFPEAYLITHTRLRDSINVDKSIERLYL
ncbi:unnamed protein product [Penicillium olsonii]|nr:unnamed protein product [Penicillium olsonii]